MDRLFYCVPVKVVCANKRRLIMRYIHTQRKRIGVEGRKITKTACKTGPRRSRTVAGDVIFSYLAMCDYIDYMVGMAEIKNPTLT
jgi:hypothetical protein